MLSNHCVIFRCLWVTLRNFFCPLFTVWCTAEGSRDSCTAPTGTPRTPLEDAGAIVQQGGGRAGICQEEGGADFQQELRAGVYLEEGGASVQQGEGGAGVQ
jgi:hypothetical protein